MRTLASIRAWSEKARAHLASEPSLIAVSVHVDEFVDTAVAETGFVRLGQRLYLELLEALAPFDGLYSARLHFPLRPSDLLDARVPNLSELESLLMDLEPPTLYLFARATCSWESDFEEYRVPVHQELRGYGEWPVVASYSCFRDSTAQANGWEYGRGIWIDHLRADRTVPKVA